MVTPVLVESSSAEVRLARAAAWLAARTERHVTVVGASLDAAAEVARRAIVVGRGASLGWQRTTLGGLAASLARTELARLALAPASPLALEAICARIVHEHRVALGRLAPIEDLPGLPRALARTLGELRLATMDLAAHDADLARLVAAYEAELATAGLADRARTLQIATAAVRAARGSGALLLVDVALRSPAERTFVEALAEVATEVLAIFPSGDTRSIDLARAALGPSTRSELASAPADAPLGHLQRNLFGSAAPAPGAVPAEAVTVLSAPGESRECVEIARLVLQEAATGTPLDRIAVLLRAPAYGAHVAEACRRAGVPTYFARGTKRPDPSGRAFLALLACAADGLSARRFSEYLSLGEVPDEHEDGAPPPALPRAERFAPQDEETLHALLGSSATDETGEPAEPESDVPSAPIVAEEDQATAFGSLRTPRHWERLLVEAAVIGSKERWQSRLAGLAAKLADDVAAYERKAEAGLADGSRRELAALDALRRFAVPLVADLAALPGQATWGEWIEKLGALATRALRRPERVLAVLGELEPMAKVASVGLAEVRLVLEPRLGQLRVPELGRRYGKLFVATTEEARGLGFDVVFIPGLAEKIFPQKVVEDPLLLDAMRRKLSPDLATNKERTDDERLALRLAIGAATRRVILSYPRLDVEQARPRTPSFYGLEVLRVAEGRLGDFEHLAKRAALTADARIGWPAPARRDDAIDEAEYDLALLKEVLEKPEADEAGEGHYLVGAKDHNPHLARALRFRWARWDGKDFRASDGLVKPPPEALEAIREHMIDRRSFSPTALQNFAACPYRFLLSAVHRLAPRQELAPIEDVDPLQRGSLTHEVLFRLLSGLSSEGALPVTTDNLESARTRLDAVLAEVAREFHDELHPAIERVWDDAIASIGADLRELLKRMTEETEWVPAHFELSFGLKDLRAQDVMSKDEPAELAIGLRLRGSIDLVEKKRDGTLRATDYKTGKVRAKKDDTVIGGGEILQPVLYALTLEALFPGTKVENGTLYYCTQAGGFEKIPVPLDDEARAAARMVAKTVGDALSNGFLPAAPKIERKDQTACTWCDFKPVCGPYEAVRTRRKPQGPLKVLAELRKRK